MSSAAEAHSLIVEIAGPQRLGAKVKSVLPRIAAATGLSERRIRGLWNMEARAVLADELKALKRVAELRQREELIDETIASHRFVSALRALRNKLPATARVWARQRANSCSERWLRLSEWLGRRDQ